MGFVSYLEDITDRLNNDMHMLIVRFETAAETSDRSKEILEEARSIMGVCEKLLMDIRDHMDLATDPYFDMAYEISQLDKEKAGLERDLADLERRRRQVTEELQQLRGERKRLKEDLKHERQMAELRERDLNKLLEANPEAAYALYSSEEGEED